MTNANHARFAKIARDRSASSCRSPCIFTHLNSTLEKVPKTRKCHDFFVFFEFFCLCTFLKLSIDCRPSIRSLQDGRIAQCHLRDRVLDDKEAHDGGRCDKDDPSKPGDPPERRFPPATGGARQSAASFAFVKIIRTTDSRYHGHELSAEASICETIRSHLARVSPISLRFRRKLRFFFILKKKPKKIYLKKHQKF